VVGVFTLRHQGAFSDKAITGAIERVLNNPPTPAPVVNLGHGREKPAALEHRRWLDSLPDEVAKNLPVNDLLGWLASRYPQSETDRILAGFSSLFFHERFRARFTGEAIAAYETRHHLIQAHPVRLEAISK